MKKDKIEQKEKDFIALRKREDEIRDLISSMPWVKLKEPVQSGWMAVITISEEGLRRKDGDRMLEAVRTCSVSHHIRKGGGDLVSKIRKGDNFAKVRSLFLFRSWNGHMIYNGPHCRSLKPKEYDALTESQRKWFDRVITSTVSRWGGQIHTDVKYSLNIPNHYLAVKVSKHMLTMEKNLSPALEKEAAFIHDKLEEYWRTSGRYSNWDDSINSQKTSRRHWKDAMAHFEDGEIDDPRDYKKLSKRCKI